jgi:hypothetical protein
LTRRLEFADDERLTVLCLDDLLSLNDDPLRPTGLEFQKRRLSVSSV